MNQDIHAALFSATPPRANTVSERFGVAWWGSPSETGTCSCCGRQARVCKGYNGGAHMKARFCVPCTASGHTGCDRGESRGEATVADQLDALRARLADRKRLDAFFAAHPAIDEETRRAIRKASAVSWYDPAQHLWSPDEVWAANPSACRECFEPYRDPNRHFGWYLAMVCDRYRAPRTCDHQHHDGEVPIA